MSRLPRKSLGLHWLIVAILTIAYVLPDPLTSFGPAPVMAAHRTTISIGDTSDDDFNVARHLRALPPEYECPKRLPRPLFWRQLSGGARDKRSSNLAIFELNSAYLI